MRRVELRAPCLVVLAKMGEVEKGSCGKFSVYRGNNRSLFLVPFLLASDRRSTAISNSYLGKAQCTDDFCSTVCSSAQLPSASCTLSRTLATARPPSLSLSHGKLIMARTLKTLVVKIPFHKLGNGRRRASEASKVDIRSRVYSTADSVSM